MVSSVPDRLSPRANEIVDAARTLLEEEGLNALSMRRLADRIGIRAPSLYKHFADKQDLEAALISNGFLEQARVFEKAAGNDDPLRAIALAYRRFARKHPHLYRLMTDHPLQRDRLAPGVEERAARALIDAVGGDRDLARAAFAFAHGMANLELNERFPPGADIDAAWDRGLEAIRKAR
jgi:AcrR family transcriptional regulator